MADVVTLTASEDTLAVVVTLPASGDPMADVVTLAEILWQM